MDCKNQCFNRPTLHCTAVTGFMASEYIILLIEMECSKATRDNVNPMRFLIIGICGSQHSYNK